MVVIDNAAQLGTGTTAISVTGIAQTGNPGYTGGGLVLDGLAAPITLNREISVSGRGPGAANASAGLVSIGYNTIAGGLTLGSTASEGRVIATHGITTYSGGVDLGAGGSNIFNGNGNTIISGLVTGTDFAVDRFVKGGILVDTTLWLQNNANPFAQTLRIDSGSVRVSAVGALGQNTSGQSIDLNGGRIEIRTDAAAGFASKSVFVRDGTTGTIFVDHGIGTYSGATVQNVTVPFNVLRSTGTNSNTVLVSRNGYSATFNGNSAGNITGGGANSPTITNNGSGALIMNATQLWNQGDTTARTLTFATSGEISYNGRISASNAAHAVAKGNSGLLSLTQAASGTASTFTGNFTISDGTVAIRGIGVLNPTSTDAGRIVFGSGALSFLGEVGTGAGQTWTNKTLDMNNANSYVLADQSGSAPTALVLPNNMSGSNNAAKNLNLGGSSPSAVINQFTGLIANATNLTNLVKFGSNTWEIQAPTSYGTAASLAIAATGGTASPTVTLTSGSTAGLVVGQPISGAGITAGATIVQILNNTTLVISSNRAASTPAGSAATGVASGATAAVTTSAVSAGTTANPIITVASTANLVPGQKFVSTNIPASGNWYIRDITSATTVTLASATGATIIVGAVPSGQSITPATSVNFGGTLSVTNGTLRIAATTATSDVINATSNLIFANDGVTNLGRAGGTFEYVGFASGSSTEALGRLNPVSGHGIVKITNGTDADTLTFLDISRSAGATLDLQPGIGTIGFTTAPTLTNSVLPGYATFNGLDFVTLSGNNAAQYTGATALVAAPTSTVNYSLASGAAVTTTGGAVNTLKIIGGSGTALTLGANLPITTNPGGVIFDNSGGTASITGAFQLGTAAQETVITTNGTSPAVAPAQGVALTTGNALSIGSGSSNTVVGSGTGSLTKAGTGTLILFGGNAYTGNTTINQGAIQLSGTAARLGTISTATNVTTVRQNAILDINAAGASAALYTGGTTYPVTTIGSLSGAGTVTNSGGGTNAQSTLNIGLLGTTTSSGTFSGALQDGAGILNVTKNGTGTQAIVGAKTYTGVTTINAGTLAVTRLGDGDSGLGNSGSASSNLIFGGGTLLYTGASTTGAGIYQITQTPSVTTNRLFSLAGNATIQSSGTYGNESGANGTGANSASLIFGNTGSIAFLTGGAKTLTLGGTSIGDNVFRPLIANNSIDAAATAFTKADAGLWILDPVSSNTYTGLTTITGGALQVAAEGAAVQGLPAASHLVLNGGVIQTSGNFTRTPNATPGTSTIAWTGIGGFAASTSKLTVNLGSGATLNLGTAPTAGSTIILSSTTALADVELQNPINLGTAVRTIQVDNNGNTGMDFATVSGVISGGAGGNLVKTGSGLLVLGNANTYVGNTTISDGQVVVSSLGGGATPSSSLGAGGGTLILNPGDGDLNPVLYVGSGETSARAITLTSSSSQTASRNVRIDSSGAGALILNGTFLNTTAQNGAGRTTTLDLRGNNTDANQMNMVLTNSTGTSTPTLSIARVMVASGY